MERHKLEGHNVARLAIPPAMDLTRGICENRDMFLCRISPALTNPADTALAYALQGSS